MPELKARLAATAHRLQPAERPDFQVLVRRAHRRPVRRIAGAAMVAAAAFVVGAFVLPKSQEHGTDSLRLAPAAAPVAPAAGPATYAVRFEAARYTSADQDAMDVCGHLPGVQAGATYLSLPPILIFTVTNDQAQVTTFERCVEAIPSARLEAKAR